MKSSSTQVPALHNCGLFCWIWQWKSSVAADFFCTFFSLFGLIAKGNVNGGGAVISLESLALAWVAAIEGENPDSATKITKGQQKVEAEPAEAEGSTNVAIYHERPRGTFTCNFSIRPNLHNVQMLCRAVLLLYISARFKFGPRYDFTCTVLS